MTSLFATRQHLLRLFALATFAAISTATMLACEAETGPDAPPRQNGCIDRGCAPIEAYDPDRADASSGDAG